MALKTLFQCGGRQSENSFTQPAITSSKLTTETPEQSVKYA